MVENSINVQVHNDFNQIFEIINYHRQRVSKTVDDESLRMIWEVGGYVSKKLKASEWGSKYCTSTIRIHKNSRPNY